MIAVIVLTVGLVATTTTPTPRDVGAEVRQLAPAAATAPSASASTPVLTWSDEFDRPAGTPVDRNRWGFDLGAHGWNNNERQYYTDSTRNVVHDGAGHLVITAHRENPGGVPCASGPCEFTSARLTTQHTFSQRYGRFEARLKVPGGKGTWPAFWMLGDDLASAGWPAAGEIDVMEHVGKQPRAAHGTVHGPGYSGARALTRSRDAGVDLAGDFHTYRVDWAPELIVWYLDGVEYARLTPAAVDDWVFDHPFFLLLNLAVGGDWPGHPDAATSFPRSLLVDYVRVWGYEPPAKQPAATPAPLVGAVPTSVIGPIPEHGTIDS